MKWDLNSTKVETITQEQSIDPWRVQGAIVDGKLQAIDYEKLIEQFGTRRIDEELIKRFEALTGRKCHKFLRRGVFFSHRFISLHKYVLYNFMHRFIIFALNLSSENLVKF